MALVETEIRINSTHVMLSRYLLGILSVVVFAPAVYGKEPAQASAPKNISRIVIKTVKSPPETVSGYVIAEGVEGGCLLQESDGRLRVIVAKETQLIKSSEEPFVSISNEQMAEKVLAELPKGFRTLTTKKKHYVICFNTTEAYAKWNGSLYERLFEGFYTYWKRLGVELHEPEFPLVAVVFESRDGYVQYAKKEEIANAESMIGYYNLLSNRIAGYDLTGIEGMIPPGKNVATAELVNRILAQPSAERTVATVVHEAVHQLAYNSGLQTRLGDNPIAISEGLAMFFESPDFENPSGWGGIGKINRFNYEIFRRSFSSRQPNSLIKLLQDDTRFHDAATTTVAYGESWAFIYFLLNTRKKEFTAYLKELSRRPPLEPTDPKRRVGDLQKHFGEDLEKLDLDFVRYMSRLRVP